MPSVIATAVPNTTDAFEVVVPKKLPEGTNALKAETPYGVAVVVPLPAKATAGKMYASTPAFLRTGASSAEQPRRLNRSPASTLWWYQRGCGTATCCA